MDLFYRIKINIYSANTNVFSQDLPPSSADLANLEKHHVGVFLFVCFNIYSKLPRAHYLFKMLQLPV